MITRKRPTIATTGRPERDSVINKTDIEVIQRWNKSFTYIEQYLEMLK